MSQFQSDGINKECQDQSVSCSRTWYHIMNRGAGRKPIFYSDSQRAYFVQLLGHCCEKFDIDIHAYCLMDNHYHLLVQTPQPSLSGAMKFLGESYVRMFNREQKTDGPLFRSRFKAILIDADAYLVQVSRYIHRNRVEAKLYKSPANTHGRVTENIKTQNSALLG